MKVGDKVWVLNIGDRSQRRPRELKEATITKVGRQYIYAIGGHLRLEDRFFISTMRHDNGGYSPDYLLYLSQEEYERSVRRRDALQWFRSKLDYGPPSWSLEALEQARTILEASEKEVSK